MCMLVPFPLTVSIYTSAIASPQARSFLGRHVSKLVVGGGAIGVYYLYTSVKPPKPAGNYEVNPMRTPGVQNIEKAYQRRGATSTHTKAFGGTPMGRKNDVPRENAGAGRPKGFGDEPRGMGDDQRAEGSRKGKLAEMFDDMKSGAKTDK